MRLETECLTLREMRPDDFDALYEIFSDAETMRHYPAPFSAEKTRAWIAWNQDNYAKYGFGLYAVVLRETGAVIGDCGITMQNIHGRLLPEIGYHIRKDHQRKGYATEAAAACIEMAFARFGFPAVYSYMKHTNAASCGVARKNGLRLVEEYPDPVNTFTRVYAITREEWRNRKA